MSAILPLAFALMLAIGRNKASASSAPTQTPESRPNGSTRSSATRPILGSRVKWLSLFGAKRSGGRSHKGLDLGADTGTPVYSPLAGVVLASDPDGKRRGYGETVIVQHDDGTATLYAHLDSRAVGVGDKVQAGTLLGRVGQTNAPNPPMVSKPHLHLEVLRPPFRRYKDKYPVVNVKVPTRLDPSVWLLNRGIATGQEKGVLYLPPVKVQS